MSFIVSFGGGVTSYEALRRTVEKHGRENTRAVFADVGQVLDNQGRVVCGEDEDLARFMGEVEESLCIQITRIKSEKYTDIWDVFFKKRMMGNTEADPCSAEMKRVVLDSWLNGNFMLMAGHTVVVGLDWTEMHRVEDFKAAMDPWPVWFPLCEEPLLTKRQIVEQLIQQGIEPPRLYEQGFSHNNCGGFCVKMGHSQAYRLWKNRRHVYDYHAGREEEFRTFVGKDVSILRDRRNNETLPMTLTALAARFAEGYRPVRVRGEGCGGTCMVPAKGGVV